MLAATTKRSDGSKRQLFIYRRTDADNPKSAQLLASIFGTLVGDRTAATWEPVGSNERPKSSRKLSRSVRSGVLAANHRSRKRLLLRAQLLPLILLLGIPISLEPANYSTDAIAGGQAACKETAARAGHYFGLLAPDPF